MKGMLRLCRLPLYVSRFAFRYSFIYMFCLINAAAPPRMRMFAFRRSWVELLRERLCPRPIARCRTFPVGVMRKRFEMVFFIN